MAALTPLARLCRSLVLGQACKFGTFLAPLSCFSAEGRNVAARCFVDVAPKLLPPLFFGRRLLPLVLQALANELLLLTATLSSAQGEALGSGGLFFAPCSQALLRLLLFQAPGILTLLLVDRTLFGQLGAPVFLL